MHAGKVQIVKHAVLHIEVENIGKKKDKFTKTLEYRYRALSGAKRKLKQ